MTRAGNAREVTTHHSQQGAHNETHPRVVDAVDHIDDRRHHHDRLRVVCVGVGEQCRHLSARESAACPVCDHADRGCCVLEPADTSTVGHSKRRGRPVKVSPALPCTMPSHPEVYPQPIAKTSTAAPHAAPHTTARPSTLFDHTSPRAPPTTHPSTG